MLILYYSIINCITPPVALAAYTAAGLAGADPMRVGVIATRLGIMSYFLPILFIYNPELLCQGPASTIVFTTGMILIAVFFSCHGSGRVLLLWRSPIQPLATDSLSGDNGVSVLWTAQANPTGPGYAFRRSHNGKPFRGKGMGDGHIRQEKSGYWSKSAKVKLRNFIGRKVKCRKA